ncbi:phage baseplate upper protein [Enterococcus gallinarum]|nr:phage baseplate upper protein [Enterococcus gallinarum]
MTNEIFKKNKSIIRIQAERVDPINTKVVFFSHDRGTAKLLFRLEKDNAPQPITNGTTIPVCLEGGAETSDMGRFRHVYHAVIEDATEGLVSILLKNNILNYHGRVDGSIYIKPPNDQQLDTAGRFTFHIEQSPIDDMTESVSQFYYDGFYEIYEQLANAKRQVEGDLTEMRVSVKAMLDEIEAEVDRYKKDVEAKFTAINNNLASLATTITQLENRLTTVRNEIEAMYANLNLSARNLLPRSSFYNGLAGWITSSFTNITSTGEYTRVSKVANAVRSTISINLDGIKQSTQYTIGLMVYVESVSAGAIGHGTGVFLRTNDGTMQDSPVGYVDFTKVGEWQLVTATGTTRPGAWTIPPQPTIAIQANISCTIRIKEFVLIEGNHYMGWFPAPSDKADQAELEATQQKVRTLEENTINLTNQFPDFDFSEQTPRPIGEEVTIAYDSQGVVFNNPTALQRRAYWASPPLGLTVGKRYHVSMHVNVGPAGVGQTFIVGTSQGENITITPIDIAAFWTEGTIGLTNWTGFSIWLPPHTSIRIRELYIYEANTDITTARVERIEQAVLDTVDIQHATGNALTVVPKWDCMAEVNVQLAGWGFGGGKWTVGITTPSGTNQVVSGRGVIDGVDNIFRHVSYTSIFTGLKKGQSYQFDRTTIEGQIGRADNSTIIAKLYRTG